MSESHRRLWEHSPAPARAGLPYRDVHSQASINPASASHTSLNKACRSMAVLHGIVMMPEVHVSAGDYEEGDALGVLGGEWEGEQGEADEGVP